MPLGQRLWFIIQNARRLLRRSPSAAHRAGSHASRSRAHLVLTRWPAPHPEVQPAPGLSAGAALKPPNRCGRVPALTCAGCWGAAAARPLPPHPRQSRSRGDSSRRPRCSACACGCPGSNRSRGRPHRRQPPACESSPPPQNPAPAGLGLVPGGAALGCSASPWTTAPRDFRERTSGSPTETVSRHAPAVAGLQPARVPIPPPSHAQPQPLQRTLPRPSSAPPAAPMRAARRDRRTSPPCFRNKARTGERVRAASLRKGRGKASVRGGWGCAEKYPAR